MQKKDSDIAVDGSVWLTVGGTSMGGPGRMALLAKVAECGSITQAAKLLAISYKAAWDAIDHMNNLAGEPLLERVSGGKGGGGSRLTSRGAQLLANFQLIEAEHRKFIDQLGRQAKGIGDDMLLIQRMGMKTSARNHFFGKVSKLNNGAVNDEVELTVTGGHTITAIVTHGSSEELGLALGVEAFALIKASSIMLVTDEGEARFSARNRLSGSVVRLQPGAVNTEVVIEIEGGATLAVVVTKDSAMDLGLAIGVPCLALFKASSVILGVPA
ncbi:MAG: TOBE domain-containing protein [Massilia sp.]